MLEQTGTLRLWKVAKKKKKVLAGRSDIYVLRGDGGGRKEGRVECWGPRV